MEGKKIFVNPLVHYEDFKISKNFNDKKVFITFWSIFIQRFKFLPIILRGDSMGSLPQKTQSILNFFFHIRFCRAFFADHFSKKKLPTRPTNTNAIVRILKNDFLCLKCHAS